MPQMKPLFWSLIFLLSCIMFFLILTILNSTVFPVSSSTLRERSKVDSWLNK